MTNERGQQVRLSTSDKVVLGTFFATQLIALLGVSVGLWSKVAVLEERVANQNAAIAELKQELAAVRLAK